MLSAHTLSLSGYFAKYKCSMPTYSLWQWWCCRCKVCANWLIVNLKNQICACVRKEGTWRKRSKFSHWIVQSCASQPMHGVWTCFLVPWYKSIVKSADAKWHYFHFGANQRKGSCFHSQRKWFGFPGSEATNICHLGMPLRAVSCRLLLCIFCNVFCLLWLWWETISNFLLWGTVNLGRMWVGLSSGKGW